MSEEATVLEALDGGVLRLTLNRPDKLNSFTPEMHLALRAGLSRACEGVHPAGLVYTLGAKASVGYGRMAFQMRGHQLAVRQPVYQESAQLTAFSEVDAYVQHLRTEREAIIEALKEAAA